MRAAAYLAVAVVLVAFGYLSLFSVGAPFLLTGALMLALWRDRSRREVMVPALLWPWSFSGAYVLFGPLGCTTTSSPRAGESFGASFTTCSNILGIDYSGSGSYSPPLWPALLAAVAVATAIALVVRSALGGRESAPAE